MERPECVFCGPELAECFGGVEGAGHTATGVDLQKRVGDHVAGVLGTGQHSADELGLSRVDAVSVVVGGWAADVLAAGELAVVLGESVEAGQPVFEGMFIGEPRVVG